MNENTPSEIKIGLKIRHARLLKNINVTDISKLMGIKRQQFHRYEAGTSMPSIKQLKKISEITGKTISWFFEEKTDESISMTNILFNSVVKLCERVGEIEKLLGGKTNV